MRLPLACMIGSLVLLAGCASPESEDATTSEDALNEQTLARPSAESFAEQAETHFTTVSAGAGRGSRTVVWQIDDKPTARVDGEKIDLRLPQLPQFSKLSLLVDTDPAMQMVMEGPLKLGTFACADVAGIVALRSEDDQVFRSSSAAPCTIAITKTYREVITAFAAIHLSPRTIFVGTISATLTSAAGATHDVRAGFVLPQIER